MRTLFDWCRIEWVYYSYSKKSNRIESNAECRIFVRNTSTWPQPWLVGSDHAHLDISSLSRIGLGHIENVLRRSRLERLEIVCTTFNPNLSRCIAQLLGSIQWSTLKCLILSRDNIDQACK